MNLIIYMFKQPSFYPENSRDDKNEKLIEGITHDGLFHNDETMATAIRIMAKEAEQSSNDEISYPVLRTRDEETILAAVEHNKRQTGTENMIDIYDVGSQHNTELALRDHHQKDFTKRHDGPIDSHYASSGLMWNEYGTKIVTNIVNKNLFLADKLKEQSNPEATLIAISQEIENTYIAFIDGSDNGDVVAFDYKTNNNDETIPATDQMMTSAVSIMNNYKVPLEFSQANNINDNNAITGNYNKNMVNAGFVQSVAMQDYLLTRMVIHTSEKMLSDENLPVTPDFDFDDLITKNLMDRFEYSNDSDTPFSLQLSNEGEVLYLNQGEFDYVQELYKKRWVEVNQKMDTKQATITAKIRKSNGQVKEIDGLPYSIPGLRKLLSPTPSESQSQDQVNQLHIAAQEIFEDLSEKTLMRLTAQAISVETIKSNSQMYNQSGELITGTWDEIKNNPEIKYLILNLPISSKLHEMIEALPPNLEYSVTKTRTKESDIYNIGLITKKSFGRELRNPYGIPREDDLKELYGDEIIFSHKFGFFAQVKSEETAHAILQKLTQMKEEDRDRSKPFK